MKLNIFSHSHMRLPSICNGQLRCTFVFLIKNGKPENSIMAILSKHYYNSIYSLGAVHERLRRWEPYVLSQVQLDYSPTQPYQGINENQCD
jgi:hypothetical protein